MAASFWLHQRMCIALLPQVLASVVVSLLSGLMRHLWLHALCVSQIPLVWLLVFLCIQPGGTSTRPDGRSRRLGVHLHVDDRWRISMPSCRVALTFSCPIIWAFTVLIQVACLDVLSVPCAIAHGCGQCRFPELSFDFISHGSAQTIGRRIALFVRTWQGR